MNYLKYTGVILLVGYTILVASSLFVTTPAKGVIGVDSGADSSLLITKAEYDTAFKEVTQTYKSHVSYANKFGIGESLFKWLAIAASAIIMLISGYLGQPIKKAEDVDPGLLSKHAQRAVSLLASVSAICILISTPLQEEKLSYQQSAKQLYELMKETRVDVLESDSLMEQSNILEDMKVKAEL